VVISSGKGETGMRDKREAIQVKCPRCKRTQIVYIPEEEVPKCPDCKVQMIIEELLDEGKSY
jgi:phage FluMu protein Com